VFERGENVMFWTVLGKTSWLHPWASWFLACYPIAKFAGASCKSL